MSSPVSTAPHSKVNELLGWAGENPGRAVLYGVAGGFCLGLVGLARVFVAYRVLSAVPEVRGAVRSMITVLQQET